MLHSHTMQQMNAQTFWSLIDKSIVAPVDQDAQLHAFYEALDQLDVETIEGFERAFQNELKRSFTWDLWGAAYVIHGGASDDGFEYFQRWLIAQGRDVFEAAVKNPDDLAGIIPEGTSEPCEFEEFGYVAMDVWSKKTGIDAVSDPASRFPYTGAASGEPSGTPLKETEAHLSKRYPKLWQRFADNPLG